MRTLALILALTGTEPIVAQSDSDPPNSADFGTATVIVVIGAQGETEYGRDFSKWADRWQQAARSANAKLIVVGRDQRDNLQDRDTLKDVLGTQATNKLRHSNRSPLWLVLVGHGTFDGRHAKFNLRGPDFSATELAQWLSDLHRPTVVINCASASGPFLNKLAAPNRVVITATKSGNEHNYARFGDYFSQAIDDTQADLDKDGQTSLLEAFLKASKRTQEFYSTDGRLATEHALLDDNADGLGTRAEWFRGIRPTRKPTSGKELDGYRAHQFHLVSSPRERKLPLQARRKRDKLELSVIKLRDQKSELDPAEYYRELEGLLVQLAELYETFDDRSFHRAIVPVRVSR